MTVFFDVDDTIYSRGDAFVQACEVFFEPRLADPYGIYLLCNRRTNEVFKASQRGEITMDEMNIYRYCKGFADAGLELSAQDALNFQKAYQEALEKITCSPVMKQILDLCAELAEGMGILTNGPSYKQRGKIAALGITHWFPPDRIIVSGEVGTDKPEPDIFRLAEKISGKSGKELLYIGDSPELDIIPAAEQDWKTVWFNRRKLDTEACRGAADYIVETEEELLSILPAVLTKI